MNKIQIEKIVEEIKAGETERFGAIVEALQQPIFRYCYHMLGQKEEAEDAVQEVLIKAYEQIDHYKTSLSFSAWVYKIAYHHCLNLLNRKKRYRMISFFTSSVPAAIRNEGETRVDSQQLSEPLHLALLQLSPAERNLIILRVVEEKEYEELATMLNKNTAALRKQYERALKKCKQYLQQQKGGQGDEAYRAIR